MKKGTTFTWPIYAWDSAGSDVTGLSITAGLMADNATSATATTNSVIELDKGYGVIITTAESNVTSLRLYPSTAATQTIASPSIISFDDFPENFGSLGISSGGAVTRVTLVDTATAITNGVTLANDAITAAKYDESTAFPLVAADTGDTQVARVGADSDTLETLSDQIDNIGAAAGAALPKEVTVDNATVAIKTVASVGAETGTYANTQAADGTYHVITHAANDIDWIYGINVGGGRTAVSVSFAGYLTGSNDAMLIQAYDFVGTDWETIANLPGQAGTVNLTLSPDLLSKHTGTGADLGMVYIRFEADGVMSSPVLNVDKLTVNAVNIGQSVGYSMGRVWVDTVNGTAGSEAYVNGTADNPVLTWADALLISASVGLTSFNIGNGSSITLTAAAANYSFHGDAWNLALGGQSIDGAYIHGSCVVTGIGTNGATKPIFEHCCIGAGTFPPSEFRVCGIGVSDGQFTGGEAGEYVFDRCYSVVAGSGTPDFVFTGLASATGINNRGWLGGINYTLDADCTISHEVLAGGSCSVACGGANVEIRGTTKNITLTTMAAGKIANIVCVTGDISINGTGGTVNIFGVHSAVTDNSAGAVTINDEGLDADTIADIKADTNELQTDWANGGRLDLLLDGTATGANVTASTGTIQADIAALNNLSSAAVQTTMSGLLFSTVITSGGAPTAASIGDYVHKSKNAIASRLDIDEATGGATLYNDGGTVISSAGTFTTLAGVTSRTKLI